MSALGVFAVVESVPSGQMIEDCQGEGEKDEETESTDVADKDAGGKCGKSKKKYKFRAGRT